MKRALLAAIALLSIVETAWGQPRVNWDMARWRDRDFRYEELSVRSVLFGTSAPAADAARVGDSWVGSDAPVTNSGRNPTAQTALPYDISKKFRTTEFFISAGGTASEDNRIFCASAVPEESVDGSAACPVLLVFHGGGGHASTALALAIARKNPGCATVAVDYNGQFSPGPEGKVSKWVTLHSRFDDYTKLDLIPDPSNYQLYQLVQVSRRVVDWTASQPWCDPAKIGCVGISYGGILSFVMAGVDERIALVATMVSSGGQTGLRSLIGRHQWIEPQTQGKAWIENYEPISYAGRRKLPVFMELSSNDRFMWITGAEKHRTVLNANWCVTPNSDHHNGGPQLIDAIPLFVCNAFLGGPTLPSFREMQLTEKGASVKVNSPEEISTVYLAWSPGEVVSPARYWHWIPATLQNGIWKAILPAESEKFPGIAYFTVIDCNNFASSSPLIEKRGKDGDFAWRGGCLWDIASGADAWRPAPDLIKTPNNLLFKSTDMELTVAPAMEEKPAAFLTNSFRILFNDTFTRSKGISLHLCGNGKNVPVKIILTRDYASLDARYYQAEATLKPEPVVVEVCWSDFKPVAFKSKALTGVFPEQINGLAFVCDKMPATGITVGAIGFIK